MDVKRKFLSDQIAIKKGVFNGSSIDDLIAEQLETKECRAIIKQAPSHRDRCYPPFITLVAFIKQIINSDKSCKRAVTHLLTKKAMNKEKQISSNTGSYCKARKRLLTKIVEGLVKQIGMTSIEKTPPSWKLFGRECKLVDGTMLSMADSKENREIYSQYENQKEGVGFPAMRLVVLMSLANGTVIDYAQGPHKGKNTGEHSLFRQLYSSIHKDDILLADAYYPTYFCVADLHAKGVDGIFRGLTQRNYDFRRGKRLGTNDHIVRWAIPPKPSWMDQQAYDSYPKEIEVRELRMGKKIYVTTLINHKNYPKKKLYAAYRMRWQVEINLRSLKTIMGMDMLVCKSPDMVRKELGIHLLAYNIIRVIMLEACIKHDTNPNKISFKGSVQLILEMETYFMVANENQKQELYLELLKEIIKNPIGKRPDRVEPRKTKRRPKLYPLMNKPRELENKALRKKLESVILSGCYA